MADKPTLVIPFEFAGDDAIKMLKKLQQAGKDSGDALEDAGKKSKTLGENVRDVITTQGYQMLKDAGQALGASFKETSDYIKGISDEFISLRETLQQVAALKGQDNSGDFTANQAREAKAAGLKPQDWVKFQEQFQSSAGAYLEGPQRKMDDDQATEYQQRIAQFARSKGIAADQAASLGAGVLQFAEKPLTPDEAMARFGRSFTALERSTTDVKQLLPQMTRVMAQGADADQASQLLSLAPEFAPGEEETHVRGMLSQIDELLRDKKSEKAKELGVTNDMTPLQKVRTASESMQAMIEAGGVEKDVVANYFPGRIENKAAGGFVKMGVRGGGFDRVAGYINDTPDDYTQSAIDKYENLEVGQHARELANIANDRVIRGSRYKDVALMRARAEAELTREGRFEEFNADDLADDAIAKVIPGGADHKQGLINKRVLANARKMNGESFGWGDDLVTTHTGATDNRVLGILEEIAKHGAAAVRPKPLAAPPANPVVRPQ